MSVFARPRETPEQASVGEGSLRYLKQKTYQHSATTAVRTGNALGTYTHTRGPRSDVRFFSNSAQAHKRSSHQEWGRAHEGASRGQREYRRVTLSISPLACMRVDLGEIAD